jgi:hypothetical protein
VNPIFLPSGKAATGLGFEGGLQEPVRGHKIAGKGKLLRGAVAKRPNVNFSNVW